MSELHDAVLQYAATGERVLLLLGDGHKLVGHIDGLSPGKLRLLERLPEGRVRREVALADIDSIASFADPEPDEQDSDELSALAAKLRREAAEVEALSDAERLIRDHLRRTRVVD